MAFSDFTFGKIFAGSATIPNLTVNKNGGRLAIGDNPTAATATGLSLADPSEHVIKKLVFTFDSLEVSAPVDTDVFGNQKLIDLSDGNYTVVGVIGSFDATAGAGSINDDADLLVSVGSTASADATLTGTDADALAVDTTTLSSGTATVGLSGPALAPITVTGGSGGLFLNLAVASADLTGTTDDTVTLDGSLTVLYIDHS